MSAMALLCSLSGQIDGSSPLHFMMGTSVGLVAGELTEYKAAPIVCATMAGVAKEAWDLHNGGRFDHHDLAFTILGGITAYWLRGERVSSSDMGIGIKWRF